MNVKHTSTGIVNVGTIDSKTGRGTDTEQKATHWVLITGKVMSEKMVAKTNSVYA